MTTYRLPEALGGGEMESDEGLGDGTVRNPSLIGFCIDDHWFWVAEGLLTKVAPPLPEEPPVGSVVRAHFRLPGDDADLEDPWVFEHSADTRENHWYGAGLGEGFTWAAVCALGTPVLLIPDPFAEPVELPWELPVYGDTLTVAVDGIGVGLGYSDGVGRLTTGDARVAARALWTAADKAERAS